MITMGRIVWTPDPRAPGLIDRLWYWRLREAPPTWEAVSRPVKGLKWARLVPMHFLSFHRRYAATQGLHWGPCVLCMTPYGGHQSGGGVPDPSQPPANEFSPTFYVGICPRCTRARNRRNRS